MGDNWKSHAKQWASTGYRVHLIDQRNHGRSFWSYTFDYQSMADDLLYYCESHKIDKCILLGHSMGGKTAMYFACQHPNFIKALVVADIAPKSYAPHHQQILRGLSALDFNHISSREEADIALAQYVNDVQTRQFLLKNLYWENSKKLGLRVNINVLKNVSEAIGEGLNSAAVSELPSLFVKGKNSDYITEEDTLTIKHHFPNATIKVIPDAGHWLHAEQPVVFFQTVTNWTQQFV